MGDGLGTGLLEGEEVDEDVVGHDIAIAPSIRSGTEGSTLGSDRRDTPLGAGKVEVKERRCPAGVR